jgi:hypothetical protein
MAYVINPDGTVTSIDASYDRNGNLRPKIDCKKLNEQVIRYNPNTAKDEKEKGMVHSTPKKKKKKPVVRVIPPKKRQQFINDAEIEMFFKDRIASRKVITEEEFDRIKSSLPQGLREYFISRYNRYKYFMGMVEVPRKRNTFKKPKTKKKAKNKTPQVMKDVRIVSSPYTGYPQSEIATFGTLGKRTPEGDMVNGRSLKGASRNPKNGYARDRYGRVQERDSYNEERDNEFNSATRHQNHYDYSSYDSNDDHDGAYDNWD